MGRSPRVPKSLGVVTSPRPKWYCQMRLTMERHVSGLSLRVIHLASAARRAAQMIVAGLKAIH